MGRSTQLTGEEQAKIDLLRQIHPDWSIRKIANTVGRHETTIGRYLKDPQRYGSRPRSGRPKVTTARQDRLIVQKAINEKMSTKQVVHELDLECSSSTVFRRLISEPHRRFSKHQSKPPLNAVAKAKRLRFAIENISKEDAFWDSIVWTDEKKFNLDGPDGLRCYWHDLRNAKTIFTRRHSSVGSVMIWAGLATNGLTEIAFCPKKMNSSHYQDIISEYLLPVAPLITNGEYILMQDNASIHRSQETKSFLEVNEVQTLEWPPYSPDLNPIENLWGYLVRKLYANGKQFSNELELKVNLLAIWESVPKEYLIALTRSLKKRLQCVIEKRGGSIDY